MAPQSVNPATVTLVSICDLERPRSFSRRLKAGLTLVGAAAATAVVLAGASPAANADVADLPDIPVKDGQVISTADTGIQPFYSETQQVYDAKYTDLLGNQITTSGFLYSHHLTDTTYYQPNSPFTLETYDNGGTAAIQADTVVGGSSFTEATLVTDPTNYAGFADIYEDTPIGTVSSQAVTQNVDNVFAYFNYLGDDPSEIAYGIQYLDLPSAANPVDEINFLGSGGEILFSIPVTGDLASLF